MIYLTFKMQSIFFLKLIDKNRDYEFFNKKKIYISNLQNAKNFFFWMKKYFFFLKLIDKNRDEEYFNKKKIDISYFQKNFFFFFFFFFFKNILIYKKIF